MLNRCTTWAERPSRPRGGCCALILYSLSPMKAQRLVWSSIPALFTFFRRRMRMFVRILRIFDRRQRRIFIIPALAEGCVIVGRITDGVGVEPTRTFVHTVFKTGAVAYRLAHPKKKPCDFQDRRALQKNRYYAKPYNPVPLAEGSCLPRSVEVPDIRSDPVGRCVCLVVGVCCNISSLLSGSIRDYTPFVKRFLLFSRNFFT